jgi:hypothetical protein
VLIDGELKERKGHSYVKIVGRWQEDDGPYDELAMTVDYTENGFKVEIGPIWTIEI